MTNRRIQFIEPLNPLCEEAINIRHILKSIQDFSDDDVLHELRSHVSLIPATQALLDALVTPRGVFLCNSTLHSFSEWLASSIDDIDESIGCDSMDYECLSMLERLIEWRKESDGSIGFVTKSGVLKPMDIGIDIHREDIDEFLKIVEIQNGGDVRCDLVGLIASYDFYDFSTL